MLLTDWAILCRAINQCYGGRRKCPSFLFEHEGTLSFSRHTCQLPSSSPKQIMATTRRKTRCSSVTVWEVSAVGKLRADQEVYYPGLQVKMYHMLNWFLVRGLNCMKVLRHASSQSEMQKIYLIITAFIVCTAALRGQNTSMGCGAGFQAFHDT